MSKISTESPASDVDLTPPERSGERAPPDPAAIARFRMLDEKPHSPTQRQAGSADRYLDDNPRAEMRTHVTRGEDGEARLRLEITNPAADTPDERAELAAVNDGLADVADRTQYTPGLVLSHTVQSRMFVDLTGETSGRAGGDDRGERTGRVGRNRPADRDAPVEPRPTAPSDAAATRTVDVEPSAAEEAGDVSPAAAAPIGR